MSFSPIAIAALIGALAGIIAALCGVGGGIVMVPAFVYFIGLEHKQAVATSLTSIILISLLATAKNHSNGMIHWPTAISCAIAGGIVAWFSADLLKQFSNAALSRGFAVLMIVVGVKMLLQR